MTVRVPIQPELLAWARERARIEPEVLHRRFPALSAWEDGSKQPTLKQLEKFAAATHAPIGYLLLPEPPEESLPVPDFRTLGDTALSRPSADLLDTIYQCQLRQDWYRDHAVVNSEEPLRFVGSLSVETDVPTAATAMRTALRFAPSERGSTWSDAFRRLTDHADKIGVLVMVSGVVGSNTHRKLDPEEFRGFALADAVAPVVFINGADTKAAQIFTLAHELAHLWLGESGISDADMVRTPGRHVERWCNSVAGEFLVPSAHLEGFTLDRRDIAASLEAIAQRFKVSTLVALVRLRDVGLIAPDEFPPIYATERRRVLGLLEERTGPSGGSFYATQPVRVSKRFTRALITSTLEGQTLHRDAFQLLGFKKVSTFNELAARMGIA